VVIYTLFLTPKYLAGKSTLLQLLAGKKLVSTPGADVKIKGQDVFRNSPSGVTFLGTEWFVVGEIVWHYAFTFNALVGP